MTFQERTLQGSAAEGQKEVNPWALGFVIMAAVFLIMSGAFHVIQGLAAIIDDDFFVVVRNYAFDFDVSTWGWIHLFSGVVLVATGFALFSGALWARIIAIFVAVASAIVSFFYIPYYPVWSIVTLAVDAGVIWALTAHGSDLAEG